MKYEMEDIKEGMMFQGFIRNSPYLVAKVHADRTIDIIYVDWHLDAPARIQERHTVIHIGGVMSDLRRIA